MDEYSKKYSEEIALEKNTKKGCCSRLIFQNLSEFIKKKVRVILCSGISFVGTLLEYDDVSNCVLRLENGNEAMIIGKSLVFICLYK